nr:protein kinase [Ktedonobacteraceae bacterium]
MADFEGQQFGNYRLLHLLGQGGFADVYLAEHIHLGTQAAIKVLSIRLTSDNVEHFRTEARTIARLVHPHIVRVLDFGVEDGTPYLIMDYAPHGSLRQRHPNGTRLALNTVVDYVKQVAEALQYAHEKKLIHRDIKPANMLLGENQLVLLSDFGIALVAQSTSNQNIQKVLGTAVYMAPEQLQGKPRRASDQYALGIVVYEWLCGERPFHGSFTELYSQHLFVPPPSLCEKAPELPLAVEEVVLRALAKDPNQRFPSVQAFATALEQAYRSVQSHPLSQSPLPNVVATPPSQPSSSIDTVAAIPPSQPLEPANTVVPTSQSSQLTLPITPSPTPTVSPPKREPTPSGGLQLSQPSQRIISRRAVMVGLVGLTAMTIAGGGIAWLTRSQRPQASSPYSTVIPSSTPLPMGTTLYTYSGHKAGMRALAWSPDGKRVATASDDYTAQVWDATTRGNAIIYRGHSLYVEGVAWSPDKPYIVSGSADGTAQIWNATTGSHIYTYLGHISTYPGSANQNHPWVNRVGWSPDGKHIVSCDQTSDSSRTATIQLWDAATGETILIYRGHTNGVYAVAWSPDGSRIASAGYDGTLQIWKAATGTTIATYRGSAFLFGLSWSPDSKYIAVGSSNAVVLVVNADNGSVLNTYSGHSNWVKDVAWSSDGKYIASGSDDEMVLLWNTATAANFYTYNGHSGHINAVGWSPNGRLIASGGDTVQVWQGP